MNSNLVIKNAFIVTPRGNKAAEGAAMKEIFAQLDSYIVIEKGVIAEIGAMKDFPSFPEGFEILDVEGRVVMPGIVDSHTHLVFGGYRPDEFSWRLKGDSYMSIMERGGGIQSTVNATRGEPAEKLEEKAQWFLDRMTEMGVTTVEAKSGYGLDTPTEVKMLDVIDKLASKKDRKLRIVSTFLGAHAVPKEYKGRTDEYCDLIINEMIPAVKDKAVFFDIFTEKNVFEIEESRRLLEAAAKAGFKLKLHADEIVTLGGSELAAEVGAVSADHLLHISDEGIRKMKEAGVVATVLPLTAFALKEPYAPARKMIDAGCAVALATDLNPGSCFSGSIPLTIALSCIYMNMSIEEVITGLTLNAAAAVDLASEIGTIEKGKRGDLAVLEFDNYHFLPYYIGMNCVKTTIYNGNIVYNS